MDINLTSMPTPISFDWHPQLELILERQQTGFTHVKSNMRVNSRAGAKNLWLRRTSKRYNTLGLIAIIHRQKYNLFLNNPALSY